MTFDICRTSDYSGRECPCEGAVLDTDRNVWTIEINSLEELIVLSKKASKCYSPVEIILTGETSNKLEIYDTCRE